ncbi:MAG TPA: SMC-Scp complex subunit ScpB [Candidatus Binataceae bacterium]|nr:SMC-Scp complex subunit ScpB [Candidatus Binataceae bacterium]
MDEERLKAILEALLFAAGEPVSLNRLAAVLDSVPKEQIRDALIALGAQYAQGGRGLTVEEVAGGYQLRTRKEFAPQVRKLLAGKPPRLSRSLLETVAIVAYRQPVTRPEIEQVRGVDCGGVLETLLERRLIKIAGRKEAPGRPILYATTSEFLEVFGLKDLESLPDLSEFQEIQRAQEEAESQGIETITEMRPDIRDVAASVEAEGAEAGSAEPTEVAVESDGEVAMGDPSAPPVENGIEEP